MLVCKFHFVTLSLNFLIVGHTHEDIHQLFSILLSLVLKRITFKCPEELRQAILALMFPVITGRQEQLGAFLLTHIRDFKGWMAPMGIHLHNAFVTCLDQEQRLITAPHSFTFKLRLDLSPQEQTQAVASVQLPAVPSPAHK